MGQAKNGRLLLNASMRNVVVVVKQCAWQPPNINV
jgi:hypothetical protein